MLLKSIREPNLQDIAYNCWERIQNLPADHADAWMKSHLHAFIIDELREECIKHDFNDKCLAERNIDHVARTFGGDFNEYCTNLKKAINNALRLGVALTENMMKTSFNNNFYSTDQDWVIWKLMVMEGIDAKTFQDVMRSGLAHDSNLKLRNASASASSGTAPTATTGVAVNFGGHYGPSHTRQPDRGGHYGPSYGRQSDVRWSSGGKGKGGGKGGKGASKGKSGGKGKHMGRGRGGGRGSFSGKGGKGNMNSGNGRGSHSSSGRGLGTDAGGRHCKFCDHSGHTIKFCWEKRAADKAERSGTTVVGNYASCVDVGTVSSLFVLIGFPLTLSWVLLHS